MWCPGAVVLFLAEIAWLVWRIWRFVLKKGQPPGWVLGLEFWFTPAWIGWAVWGLWRRWVEKQEERRPPAITNEPRQLVNSEFRSPRPALILTDTPLGPLPDYFDPAAIHPAATARIFRDSGEVPFARVEEWKQAVRARGYDVRTLAGGTQAEGWEIRVRTIPTSSASVWA